MIAGRHQPHSMETATPAPPEIAARLDAARASLAESGADQAALAAGVEAARTVAALTHDADLALGTMLHRLRRAGGSYDDPRLEARLGAGSIRVAIELERLGELHLPAGWTAQQGLNAQQAEILRKMLLAVAADPRLVVAHLAEQLVELRDARTLSAPQRLRLATETREILAPLANRLGVWSLKWELEDLSFRYLEPEAYHRIARALAERRVDRERYIAEVCALLLRELSQAGVAALAVYGRPKHIYSIWRKMRRKQLAFEQLFDVRAVRIVVESIEQCYAALGVVHEIGRA